MVQIKSRIWIEKEGAIYLGYGRIELLKKIGETQSISAAAKAMNMSYKKAWKLITAMNGQAKAALVEKNIGGKNGGGTYLTPYALEIIQKFDTLNRSCEDFLDAQFKTIEL